MGRRSRPGRGARCRLRAAVVALLLSATVAAVAAAEDAGRFVLELVEGGDREGGAAGGGGVVVAAGAPLALEGCVAHSSGGGITAAVFGGNGLAASRLGESEPAPDGPGFLGGFLASLGVGGWGSASTPASSVTGAPAAGGGDSGGGGGEDPPALRLAAVRGRTLHTYLFASLT